jgi:hypothetical protein
VAGGQPLIPQVQSPPPPAGTAPAAPLVQFAQQIIQRPGSLNDFSPEIQRMLIEGLQQQDKFNFDLAIKSMEVEDKDSDREMRDREKGRNQLLWLVGSILTLGSVLAGLLAYKGQYALAIDLVKFGGTSLVSALGGFGLGRTKIFGGGHGSDGDHP